MQTLAVVVEVAALALIVLDIYLPEVAHTLEAGVHRTSSYLTQWKERTVSPPIRAPDAPFSLGRALSGIWPMVYAIRVLVQLVIWLTLWPLRMTLQGLDRLAKGHALAGLGLVLAVVALGMEVYQLFAG